MEKFKCKYCGYDKELWLLKPFEVKGLYVKYSFHVKELCGHCHKFQRFVKQDDKVIKLIDEAVLLPGTDILKELPFE